METKAKRSSTKAAKAAGSVEAGCFIQRTGRWRERDERYVEACARHKEGVAKRPSDEAVLFHQERVAFDETRRLCRARHVPQGEVLSHFWRQSGQPIKTPPGIDWRFVYIEIARYRDISKLLYAPRSLTPRFLQ